MTEKKGGKQSKQHFLVSVDGEKVDKPTVIWKSKKPRAFRQANATWKISRFLFFKHKSSMQVEITENVSVKLNEKMIHQERSVILFMDNAFVHPKSLRIVYLPKNTTSSLPPLDPGIVQQEAYEVS